MWVFGIRQRRAMGLTFKNVMGLLKEMNADGDLEDKTMPELAVEVLHNLVDGQPAAFKDPEIDWDSLLAFLEKLIPLIVKILGWFI